MKILLSALGWHIFENYFGINEKHLLNFTHEINSLNLRAQIRRSLNESLKIQEMALVVSKMVWF